MRFEGVITRWDDERGFGFIEPSAGGEPVFVHIKAFRLRGGRPVNGIRVQFAVEASAQGEKRAADVEVIHARRPGHREVHRTRADSGSSGGIRSAPVFAVAAFVALYALATSLWTVPKALGFWYVGASLIAFMLFAHDKAAAERGRWRVKESTLQGLALLGGWPGAAIGQELLRHKRRKASFQWLFWTVVVLNVAGFLLLVSPFGRALIGR